MSARQRAIIEKMDAEFAKNLDQYAQMQDQLRARVLAGFANEATEATEAALICEATEAAEIFKTFKSLESPLRVTAWDSPLCRGSSPPRFAPYRPRSITPATCDPAPPPDISEAGRAYLAGLDGGTPNGFTNMHPAYLRGCADRRREPPSPMPACYNQSTPTGDQGTPAYLLNSPAYVSYC